jgi:hypothetical protein
MGDRGNIVMKFSNGKKIYFYTHWRGSELEAIVYRALAREQRWSDAAYLSRIVFSELIKGEEREEIGYGITPYETEQGSPKVLIDTTQQTVSVKGSSWTFHDYIQRKDL